MQRRSPVDGDGEVSGRGLSWGMIALLGLMGQLLFVGAVFFMVSDMAVAKARFVRKSIWDRRWGLPAYYTGQLCIAWSLVAQ